MTPSNIEEAKRAAKAANTIVDEVLAQSFEPKFAVAIAFDAAMALAERVGLGPMQFAMLALQLFQKRSKIKLLKGDPCPDCGLIHPPEDADSEDPPSTMH